MKTLPGRFSVISPVNLINMLELGIDNYKKIIEGVSSMDKHFYKSTILNNLPVNLALVNIWNINFLSKYANVIVPYAYRLRSFPDYLQQIEMESNGKSINFESEESPFLTSPLIWGGYGVDSQHSTFQWLMQGKTETSCDFIGLNNGQKETVESYEMLLAQVLATTYGKSDKESPFKSIKGNNPCSILQMNSIDLKGLGFLLAIYEHKVFGP